MKKLILIVMILCSAMMSDAQFTENWNVRYQATGTQNYSNEGRKIAVDAMGNTFVLGDFSSDRDTAGNMLSGGVTQYTVRLFKYDYLGNLVYKRCYIVNGLLSQGSENIASFGLELDASNNVYIGYNIVNSLGNRDVVFKKLNNTLTTELMTRVYATPANEYGVDMKVAANGQITSLVRIVSGSNITYAIVVAGNLALSAMNIYNFTANVEVLNTLAITARQIYVTGYTLTGGVKSLLVAAISSSGSLLWKQNFNNNTPTSGDDVGNHIIIGVNGKIYVAGTTYTSPANGTDAIAIIYDINGSRVAQQLLHQGNLDKGWRIVNGPASYVYLVSSGATDVTIFKMLASNLVINSKATYLPTPASSYTGITGITVTDVKVSNSGNAYVAGTVTCSSAAGTFGASFLSKFGMNGLVFKNLDNMKVLGSFTDSYSTVAIAINPLRTDVVLLKNAANTYTSHSTEKMCVNSQDVALPFRQAEDNINTKLPVISISPNPASDHVTINCQQPVSTVALYDILGKQALIQNAGGLNSLYMDLGNLENGVYICRIVFENGQTESRRLVVR